MPVVCYYVKSQDIYLIVDGFHRYQVMMDHPDIYEREQGLLPVSVIEKPIDKRMASTVRHNRVRGTHDVDLMSNIVKELHEFGRSDAWISKHLGMDRDEILRLKQITGLAALFRDIKFGEAWCPVEEETHCYLLNGSSRSLLIDTGLGICNIYDEVMKLTNKPVTAVATHIHWDHIGGHKYFPDFYAHAEELSWLNGEFPLTIETIREMVADRCDLPDGYDTGFYEFFQGTPTKVLEDGENIELGGRNIQVLHTPGHAPGHMCFWESDRGYLFTGDLVYKDTLFAYYPSTDPDAYLASLEKISELPVKKVFPAHHSLDIQPEILIRMRNAFRQLREDGKLQHGSGTFDYGDWAVWL